MDTTQIVLFVVIVILAILLLALGIQVFFILREFRRTVSKANKVLDSAETVVHNVSTPISSLTTLATGVKTGASIIGVLRKIVSRDEHSGKKNKKDSDE